MAEHEVTRKLAAILSADVVGYSRLMGADEPATVETLKEYRAAMRRVIVRHKGRVVNAPGDALLAEFPSAVEAVQSAIEIQKALEGRNVELSSERRMQFRIGVNVGDVIEDEEGSIFGDGVNIAARMEALADAGGVCISSSVFDAIEGKVDCGFDFLGEHHVKNISKPVTVYRVRSDVAAAPTRKGAAAPGRRRLAAIGGAAVVIAAVAGVATWLTLDLDREPEPSIAASDETAADESEAAVRPPLEKSIAVLPFENMSGDPAQEYFADGITEAIINGLSGVPELFVIARNSSSIYKGQAVRTDRVGRELGVRYVLEGSVQRVGDRVRITAQLIDAASGGHVWANQYDRDLTDIFALQDEVKEQIVGALEIELTPTQEASEAPAPSIDAYDLYLRASAALDQATDATNREAERLFEQAIAADPDYANAYMGLGRSHLQRWQLQWSRDPLDLERALEFGEKARDLDPWLAARHAMLGEVYLWRKEHEAAIASAERAVELDPSNADVHAELGEILNFSGRPADSIELVQKAMRLNPRYPWSYPWTLGQAYMLTDQPNEAITTFEETVEKNPDLVGAHVFLAILYAEQGRDEEARHAYDEVKRLSPEHTFKSLQESLPYESPAQLERIENRLVAVGLAAE